ncbi:zinc finger protein 391-like [Diaphorina citri]|uniref:Zinc finger protein 391-like n=1 Tax=Diaphorina citri TaxID=121845 RepID=A0A1S3DU68_DIACI|nr:zinc finger protein 391-like [Diaphorina citri]
MKQSLAMHIKKMNREPEQHYDKPKQVEFPCVYCGKIFPRLGLLKEHTKTHHLKVRYTCDICSQDYSTKYYLKLHKQVHEGKQHECEECSRLFPSSKMLYDHTMRSHKTRVLFKCHQCSRKYMSKPSLRRHIYANHINKGVRFSCHLCGKSFHREQSLRKHLREEENQDQLHCDKCRYKTFLKSNLIAHVHGYHRLAITLTDVLK